MRKNCNEIQISESKVQRGQKTSHRCYFLTSTNKKTSHASSRITQVEIQYLCSAQNDQKRKRNTKADMRIKALVGRLLLEVVFRPPLYVLRHCKSTHRDEIDGFPTDNKYF